MGVGVMTRTAPESIAVTSRLLDEQLPGRVRRAEPLGPFTTYRVGGPAALFLEVDDLDELQRVARITAASGVPTLVVGRGSNLLVADRGFPGLALVLGDGFASLVIDGTDVVVGGATALPVAARQIAAAGLTGFEWAVGVPGSIGGAVCMNAGGHGSDMAASLIDVEIVDLASGTTSRRPVAELGLGYRTSAVGPAAVVTEARLGLAPGDVDVSSAELSEIVRWRRDHQPGGQNAGSVFTNPDGDSAGALIDQAGGKGLRIGSAEVSPKHANFIQADPEGRAYDVLAVMAAARRLVAESFAVDLHPETRLVGFTAEEVASVAGVPR